MLLGSASNISQQVLRTDVAGMPLEWIDYKEAASLYYSEQVAYACGTRLYTVYGGFSALDGHRSSIDVSSIIATRGTSQGLAFMRDKYVPPLNNRTLFKRDADFCLYCAMRFPTRELTRDHITPLSQGGQDVWNNVATACRRCNNHKGGMTPEQAKMQLIAVPFTPTYAEYIYLKGRRVLIDQMKYLLAHIPRSSPLHARLTDHLSEGDTLINEFAHD
jgi:hypothetical protein